MKFLAIVSLFTLFLLNLSIPQSLIAIKFEQWQSSFGKRFSQSDAHYRMYIYRSNLQKIREHNEDPSKTYTMGENQFTGQTQQEFQLLYLAAKPPKFKMTVLVGATSNMAPKVYNNTVNWTTEGTAFQVRNQGVCGSCWAISVVEAIQITKLIKDKESISLSQQQLVDCSISYGNQGCLGGWPSFAMDYVEAMGVTFNANYPYTTSGGPCKHRGGETSISYYRTIKGCEGMLSEVESRPVVVEVDASRWNHYQAGVFTDCKSEVNVNHAVLLLGYDADLNWWIKNSWGSVWGENGYILLKSGNSCGVCDYPGYSVYL